MSEPNNTIKKERKMPDLFDNMSEEEIDKWIDEQEQNGAFEPRDYNTDLEPEPW